ncbi:MAG TPA: CHAD domain-containing protein [Ignavibacteriaceae bacterium]|nr:CHAD domain-containing protein [Ignavibacteriaceae bacterium]
MNKKKWEIKDLSPSETLTGTSKKILSIRLNDLVSSIKLYFENETEENLHNARIAVRRLRYSMELFVECFDRKKFLSFYNRVQNIQDLTGEVRDLDVLKQNISTLSAEGKVKVSSFSFGKIDEKRQKMNENLKLELMKFIHSKRLKDFSKIIS